MAVLRGDREALREQRVLRLRKRAAVCALVAAAISAYLALGAFADGRIAGCGGGGFFDCASVLNSRWSRWFTLPVALPAIFLYLTIAMSQCFLGIDQPPAMLRRFWIVNIALAVTAVVSAAWFFVVQFAIVGGFCVYCTVVHLCACLVLFFVWRAMRVRSRSKFAIDRLSRGHFIAIGGAVVVFLIVLAVGQAVPGEREWRIEGGQSAQAGTSSGNSNTNGQTSAEGNGNGNGGDSATDGSQSADPAPPVRQRIEILEGANRTSVFVDEFPIIGSPDNKVIFVKVFDYTCPACRTLHLQLKTARQHFGNRFSVLLVPVPLETSCNRHVLQDHPQHEDACQIARAAMAVWLVDREKYLEFHDWMFEPSERRTLTETVEKAKSLIGAGPLAEAMKSEDVTQRLLSNIELYGRTTDNTGKIPKLIYGELVAIGEAENVRQVIEFIEDKTGLHPDQP